METMICDDRREYYFLCSLNMYSDKAGYLHFIKRLSGFKSSDGERWPFILHYKRNYV